MSKTTLAIIAATSAAAGASITALVYSSRKQEKGPATVTSQSVITTTSTAPAPKPPGFAGVAPLPPVLSPVNPSGILQYGSPGPIVDILTTPSHLASYNRITRNPHWVAEHLTPLSLAQNNANRRNSVFYEDKAIPTQFQAKLSDYAQSGYDRGHQVPAADAKWSQEAMDSTFTLTNMCPQVGEGFNRDYWAHFEEFCRTLAKKYPSVRVVTGPLYLPKKDEKDGKWRVSYEVVGNPPNVAVPTHFYKIIYGEEAEDSSTGKVALGAFVLPNAEIRGQPPLSSFEVPIEAVERASGLSFVDLLPVARRKRLCDEVQCGVKFKEFKKATRAGPLIGQ